MCSLFYDLKYLNLYSGNICYLISLFGICCTCVVNRNSVYFNNLQYGVTVINKGIQFNIGVCEENNEKQNK